ncbi:hypothetical protein C8J56DRAFT_891041 [Mycena floridula]|nr:hypothetical protein C8J56DRAFT_891041 [Mycena floridula]
MLESLGFPLSWLWSSSSAAPDRKRTKIKKGRAPKAESIALGSVTAEPEDGYYPGLVNVSGTYCFMNSTIQALSSLSYLQPQIDAIHKKADEMDVPTPVIDALQSLFHRLNTPHSSYTTIRPIDMISVLSSQPDGRSNSLFNSREHQDAQELFQLLSECIKNETANVDKEAARDRGLGGLSKTSEANKEFGKSVFDGLTANRRSCVVCGYTEAVMHFAFDNWQLAVPTMASSCFLEECLEEYTRLEVLKDCICRRCSVNATHRRLLQEAETLEEALRASSKPSASKKRRLKDVRKMEMRVKAALDEGRIEEELKDIRMEKVISGVSTKQAMIARPPPVLALHLNRSVHFSHYASKNTIRVFFPEILDLTPFTTSGNLSTVPTSSMSSPSTEPPRSTTPTPASDGNIHARTLYRLSSVVCHYGAHSFGHYICYRRKPRGPWKPPRLIFDPAKAEKASYQPQNDLDETLVDYVWEDPTSSWLRISDDAVSECGIETVLKEGSGAFMLYYERVIISTPEPVSSHPYSTTYGVRVANALNSDETLKPELTMSNGNASVASLISQGGIVVRSGIDMVPNGRIIRSVAARSRSASVANGSKRASSVASSSRISIPQKLEMEGESSYPEMSASAPSLSALKPGPLGLSGSPSSSGPLPSTTPSSLTSETSAAPLSSTSRPSPSTSGPSLSSSVLSHNHQPPLPAVVGLKA